MSQDLKRLEGWHCPTRYEPLPCPGLVAQSRAVMRHSGRMKPSVARAILRAYAPDPESRDAAAYVVADPMAGIGTTLVLAADAGLIAVGAEKDRVWRQLTSGVLAAQDVPRRGRILCADAKDFDRRWLGPVMPRTPDRLQTIGLILTSPPFPSAHSPGSSRMQDALLGDKGHHAGGSHGSGKGVGEHGFPRSRARWSAALRGVLAPWVAALSPAGVVAIHVKNHVEKGAEVQVDLWTAEVLAGLGLDLLGYHPFTLGYRSGYVEWQRYPRVPVVEAGLTADGLPYVEGPCGHVKTYRRPLKVKPARFVCVGCGERPGHVEVLEERVVVARGRSGK